MERDKRLGIKHGAKGRELPLLTLSNKPLGEKPYETMGLGETYFVVLDPYLKPVKRDALIAELQGIVQSYSTPAKPSKTTDTPKTE